MTRIFIPTVGSSATSANRRHLRLPLQAAPGAARGIVTSSRATPSKPPLTRSRPRFASASGGEADGELALFPIAAQGSGRVGSLRGFLPRALSNACPHASSCTHGQRTRAGIEQRLTGSDLHSLQIYKGQKKWSPEYPVTPSCRQTRSRDQGVTLRHGFVSSVSCCIARCSCRTPRRPPSPIGHYVRLQRSVPRWLRCTAPG